MEILKGLKGRVYYNFNIKKSFKIKTLSSMMFPYIFKGEFP
jgi:hypothetical protein